MRQRPNKSEIERAQQQVNSPRQRGLDAGANMDSTKTAQRNELQSKIQSLLREKKVKDVADATTQ